MKTFFTKHLHGKVLPGFLLAMLILFAANVRAQSQSSSLWAQTSQGGANSLGGIFSINLDGSGYNIGYNFSVGTNSGGAAGSLVYANGLLWGMTYYYGTNGGGNIFSFDPATNAYSDVFDFDASTGKNPSHGFILGLDGLLYGTTVTFGPAGFGNLFSFDPANPTNPPVWLVQFDGTSANNGFSQGGLIQTPDGTIYGLNGIGANGDGAIFSYDPINGYQDVFDFSFTNGSGCSGNLILASDGNLYGLSSGGGANNNGVIFSINPLIGASSYLDLVDFNNTTAPAGATPIGSLMQASNGVLYGMAEDGGVNSSGVLFSYDYTAATPSGGANQGAFTDLLDFDGTNGNIPMGSLMQASNGLLYGMTYIGGDLGGGDGVIFNYDYAAAIPSGGANQGAYNVLENLDFFSASNPGNSSFTEIPLSITTGTISSPTCTAATISVPYTNHGGTFNGDNIFTAQLSDASGSFTSPVNIGTVSASASGIITAQIPTNSTPGTGYRIRVVGTDPAITGSDNGSDITIKGSPIATLSGGTVICEGASLPNLNIGFAGSSPWDLTYTINNVAQSPVSGISSSPYTISNAAAGNYIFTVTGGNGCVASVSTAVIVNPIPTVNSVSDQTICSGSSTNAVNFSGTVEGINYNWTNNTPSIGLAASGSGDIASFIATNTGSSPVTATITATPVEPILAYIANSEGSSSVSVIDVSSNLVIASIPVGASPIGVSVNPDGSSVYVADLNANSVSVISVANNTVSATIPVGSEPNGLVVSPDGSTVYVANAGTNTVSVISTATNTVTATIIVGNAPTEISISPDGSTAYVTNQTDGTVSAINTATNDVTNTITVGIGPWGIAISPDGSTVYVVNESSSGTVSVINTVTNTVTTTISVGNGSTNISITPNGNRLYVTNSVDNTVSVINTATNTVTAIIPVGTYPSGVSVTPDGNSVYVTNFHDNTVSVISTASNTVTNTIAVGGFPNSPGNFITGATCPGTPVSFTITVNPSSAAPTATAGSGATAAQITANWDAVAGATDYYLDVSLNNSFSSFVAGYDNFDAGNVTSLDVTGLSSTKTYYYRVRASNTCGTSSNSNTITYSTVGCPTSLTIYATGGSGSNPNTVICSGDGALIQWEVVNGEGLPNFEYSADGQTGWINLGTSATPPNFNTPPLTSTTYFRAIITNSCFSLASNTVEVAVSAIPVVTLTNITPTSVSASWTPFAANSNVSYSLTCTGASTQVFSPAGNNPQTITVTPGSTLNVTVAQTNPAGCTVSGNASINTQLAAPTLTLSAATARGFTASWTSVTGASSYTLYYRMVGGNGGNSSLTTSLTTATLNGLYGDAIYLVYVVANEAGYTGAVSTEEYISTLPGTSTCATPTITNLSSPCANEISVTMTGSPSNIYRVTFTRLSPNPSAAASYNVTGGAVNITIGVQYANSFWQVLVASNCSGVSSEIANPQYIFIKAACPQLQNLVLSTPTCRGFEATWNPGTCTSPEDYYIYIQKQGAVSWNAYPVGANNYVDVDWIPATTWNAVVEQLGCNGAASAYSAVQTITTGVGCRTEEEEVQADNSPSNDVIEQGNAAMNIYPNPTNGNFMVNVYTKNKPDEMVQIEMVNTLGQVVFTVIAPVINGISNNVFQMPENVASGIYLVRTIAGGENLTKQVIYTR